MMRLHKGIGAGRRTTLPQFSCPDRGREMPEGNAAVATRTRDGSSSVPRAAYVAPLGDSGDPRSRVQHRERCASVSWKVWCNHGLARERMDAASGDAQALLDVSEPADHAC